MVYESGFTTRRTYTSRPIVSSYTVSYPTVERVSRVYKTSFPIYSSYTIPRYSSRVITSPVRVVTSPSRIVTRVISSPTRTVRTTTTRVISSPERITSSYYSPYVPSTYVSSYIPSTYVSSYIPSTYIPSTYTTYTTPSYVYSRPYYSYSSYTPITTRIYSRSLSPALVTSTADRIQTSSYLKRTLPGYGARALTNYLSTEPFETFRDETNRIRRRAQTLVRELHAPVYRRARSCTPFPVSGYSYEPASQLAFDAYLARITNPARHVAKEVYNMSHYPEPARKYVGKSHLASVRICGDKAYNIRNPMYDSDKIRTDINLMSWYMRHPRSKTDSDLVKKIENNEEGAAVVEVAA